MYEEDRAPILQGEVVELDLDLMPTSHRLRRGYRIRLSIAGADQAEGVTQRLDPAPVVTVWHDHSHPSRLIRPVILE